MDTISAQNERIDFSVRLVSAIAASGFDPRPVMVTREFNVRSNGDTVTSYAVRRWLYCRGLPTQSKMEILAQWLGVTAEWLRFGKDPQAMADDQIEKIAVSREVEMIVNDYRKLNEHSKFLFDRMLFTMLSSQEVAPENE